MRILNETEFAENIIKNGFSKNKIVREIKILGKYYVQQGIVGQELKDKINDFCNKKLKNFNEVLWIKSINSICRYAERNSLFDIKPVRITVLEYNKIKELNNIKLEKLSFALLVLAKINKQSYMVYLKDRVRNRKDKSNMKNIKFKGYYVTESFNEIFKMANVNVSGNMKYTLIKELVDARMVNVTKTGNLIVNFVNNHTTEDFVVLDKFNNFILEYEKTFGVKVKYCEVCGEITKDTIHNKKYCKTCWKENQRELDRIYQKNKYNSRVANT